MSVLLHHRCKKRNANFDPLALTVNSVVREYRLLCLLARQVTPALLYSIFEIRTNDGKASRLPVWKFPNLNSSIMKQARWFAKFQCPRHRCNARTNFVTSGFKCAYVALDPSLALLRPTTGSCSALVLQQASTGWKPVYCHTMLQSALPAMHISSRRLRYNISVLPQIQLPGPTLLAARLVSHMHLK